MQERKSQSPAYQTARGKLRPVGGTPGTPTISLDPGTADFIKRLEAQGGPPPYTLSPAKAREVLLRVQSSMGVAKIPADVEEREIPGGPTGQVSIRIVRPQGIASPLPR